jgi:HlyD family secretion protein
MKVNLEVQGAKVANARARVKEKEDSLAKLEVLAPEDGMVSLIPDWENNKPAIGETVWMGRSLIDLPSLEKLAVKVEIDEADSASVLPGQSVRVVLDAPSLSKT